MKYEFNQDENKERLLELRDFLESKVIQFNRPEFIKDDPISIPHQFKMKQDIEIAGMFAAVLAWGQRITIINKSKELMALMGKSPYDFILHHKPANLERLMNFKHRTFNTTDLLYFIHFLKHYYQAHTTLEDAFYVASDESNIGTGLIQFRRLFCALPEFPLRTKKHISTPESKSACKRLSMYLRWMVRADGNGVDFGLWKRISPSQLVCPCDLHVDRVARKLKLIRRKPLDWGTALELTANLRLMDAADPVKFDFALFGLGIEEDF